MNKVQVSNSSVDESLERSTANTLDDSRPEHAVVVLVHSTSPRTGSDQDEGAQNEEMALPPDAARGHEDETSDTAS